MTRGGKRPGAGRPKGATTTGMTKVPPIHFRVSADQHTELTKAGAARKPVLSASGEAKRRTFAKGGKR